MVGMKRSMRAKRRDRVTDARASEARETVPSLAEWLAEMGEAERASFESLIAQIDEPARDILRQITEDERYQGITLFELLAEPDNLEWRRLYDALIAEIGPLPRSEEKRISVELEESMKEWSRRRDAEPRQVDRALIQQWIRQYGAPVVPIPIGESKEPAHTGEHEYDRLWRADRRYLLGVGAGIVKKRRITAEDHKTLRTVISQLASIEDGGLLDHSGIFENDALGEFVESKRAVYSGGHEGTMGDAAARIRAAAELLSAVYPAEDVGKALEGLAEEAARETTGRAKEPPPLTPATTETHDQTIGTLDTGSQRLVAVDSVIRGASYIVGATSIMSILATIVSGAVIIQPALATLLLIAALGFYCMTLLKN